MQITVFSSMKTTQEQLQTHAALGNVLIGYDLFGGLGSEVLSKGSDKCSSLPVGSAGTQGHQGQSSSTCSLEHSIVLLGPCSPFLLPQSDWCLQESAGGRIYCYCASYVISWEPSAKDVGWHSHHTGGLFPQSKSSEYIPQVLLTSGSLFLKKKMTEQNLNKFKRPAFLI